MATRWLATLACVVAILGGATPAHADDRLTIAVLGLEVVGGVADPRQTAVAHDITEGLRIRARLGQGYYAYAPSSERELIDEKLIKSCDSEGPTCMSLIAKDIGADVLVYGKLDKEPSGYRIILHLLDAGKPAKLNRISVTAPLDLDTDEAHALAKKFYDDLIGTRANLAAMGTIEISANIDEGTVFVDDNSASTLEHGKATLELPEGRYRIAIEAAGKQRKELQLTVKAKETVEADLTLTAKGVSTGSGGDGIGIWKPTFIVSASLTGVLGVYTIYLLASWHSKVGDIDATKVDDPATPADESKEKITASDCDGPSIGKNIAADRGGTLGSLCQQRDTQSTMAWLTAGVGVVAVVSGVMYFRTRQNKERAGVAVLPVVSGDGGGAIVQLRW
ncbi:MAG TPA: hypothetical protein VGM90_12165 [Kofleriaceae bacterium]|jgi:hypothetical protein